MAKWKVFCLEPVTLPIAGAFGEQVVERVFDADDYVIEPSGVLRLVRLDSPYVGAVFAPGKWLRVECVP